MTIKVHFNAVNELYPESTGYQFTTNERGTGGMLRDAKGALAFLLLLNRSSTTFFYHPAMRG